MMKMERSRIWRFGVELGSKMVEASGSGMVDARVVLVVA